MSKVLMGGKNNMQEQKGNVIRNGKQNQKEMLETEIAINRPEDCLPWAHQETVEFTEDSVNLKVGQ